MMRSSRKAVSFVIALGAATAGASAAPYDPSDFANFRSPTGNIGCVYSQGILRCDVVGGVVPLPPRPANCPLDWGQGYTVGRTGPSRVVCAGDTALGAGPVLHYGNVWSKRGLTCRSASNGMTCTNLSGHGFFVSRGDAWRF